jgi:hypothetical protein
MLTAPTLSQLLTQELAVNYRLLVLDLNCCGFLGSAALAALVPAQQPTHKATRPVAAFAQLN